ncbi:MAG: YceI family protein [Hydrogenophaga sp.]|jgi:polyisoprenoid-binding protein YceI|uniref:YceI family protein n=1 Tax=Hydrogenophaga sp. TaxID=1904254 RepID=UPI00272186F0|nr:YceI family protein [Hydrogenophaga sp.]MDO9480586.1 YceI family protein [Hydrogenophaga sp.]MDP2093275.1 YceI family protein [Hydrogenophaga sp.]MDP3343296.1 YceI family protein [Hydrogenophaga sp.]MDP3808484.1 YceI family protein [Hydrogenophaga sp.]MDP3922195.1 YceI family protein [Hydrogenophaga sp.]
MRKTLTLLAAAATLSTGAFAADYAIDPTHTFATFEIGHFGASVNRGRFDKKDGKITFDKAARTGSVDISFDVASVNTGTAGFDKHLQSPDILDAAKYPKARFVSSKFLFDGDKVSSVEGQLTLLDKTQPVTLKANQFNCFQSPMLKREVCGGDFEATIDRTAFGVNYGVDWGFPKNVRLVLQVEAVKQ